MTEAFKKKKNGIFHTFLKLCEIKSNMQTITRVSADMCDTVPTAGPSMEKIFLEGFPDL